MTTIDTKDAQIVTMRDLSQSTAKVIDEINASKQPALVTRHGRFVAMITPLQGARVESLALEAIAAEVADHATHEEQKPISSEALLAEFRPDE